ncbi:MAG: lamin tail domain-containing protein [Nanoarchaeota archaeon]|nr:lamin tail domain-containing protein [Nanoarchaeota archaeon]
MAGNSWLKNLDTVLNTSFTNLKYDVREIYRLINEIKNILIEAEPLEVRQRITVIENSLQDHVATVKKLEVISSEMKDDVKKIRPADNKELVAVFKDVRTLLVQNQKTMEKLGKNVDNLMKTSSERKKEMREIKTLAKNLEKEVKKKPKIIKIEARPKSVSKKTAAKKAVQPKNKPAKKPARKSDKPKITSAQFQAKRKGDLNSEWVEVTGKADMTGWMIQDKKRKHTYKFPKGFVLDGSVKVHTGKGADSKNSLYWNNPMPVWNDLSDVAALKNKKGVIVSRARSERTHDFKTIVNNDKINITSVQFEAPGSDRDANGEWVEIKGSGRMGGWTLEDKNKKHIYTFPIGFVLNGSVRVYSGHGKDTDTKLFWGNPNPIWNDDYDISTLKHKDGDIVSQVESKMTHNFEMLK